MTIEAPRRAPDQDELQALIEEARQRARRRRRRNGMVLAAAALIAAGSYVLATRLVGNGTTGGKRSSAAAFAPQAAVPGRFWYTRAISSTHVWMPAGGRIERRGGYFRPRGPEVLFDVRLSEETWVGIDGTMRDRVAAVGRFASAAGRARWAAYGRPLPNFNVNGWLAHDAITVGGGMFPPQLWYPWGEGLGPYGLDLGDSLFSYRQLLSLATGPTALLAELKRAEKALARRENRTAEPVGYETQAGAVGELTDVAGLLASPLSASVRLALLRAAVTLPGARVNTHAHDARGRPGIAVTATAGLAMQRLIFDPATGALLEGPKGAAVAQGAVGSAYALPKRISPIRVAGGPPAPPTLAITPRAGNPTTVFRVMLAPARGRRSRKTPALEWTLAGTPGSPCFASGFTQPLLASATTWLAGRLTYVYRLKPPRAHGHTWCRGRYELNVVPDYSSRSHVSYPRTAGSPTFSPRMGSSIFFQVR